MNKNLFFVFLIGVLVGCNGEQKVEQSKVQPKATEAPKTPVTRDERKAAAVEEVKTTAKEKASPVVKVDLTPLQGNKLGDLYAEYLGIPKGQLVPPFVIVSFDERMGHMYQKKINFEKCRKKTGVCKEASDTVLSKAPELYNHYLQSEKKQMSFKQFIGIANTKVISARKFLNWDGVCKHYKLGKEKCFLLQGIVSKIAGKDMVAYGMTELLPSSFGDLNVTYMDVMLRNAGAEFLYHVPALGDELASLGFYQFTMYALRKDEEATEGASIINTFVKEGGEKIPNSVVYLDGHQHHVAAFYFAVHNLARLVSSLSNKGVKTLTKVHVNHQDEMVMFIAAAHHAPKIAIKKTATWVDGGLKSTLLTAYGKERIRAYAIKTKANLHAVYKQK